MSTLIYLNGKKVEYENAVVSVEDRGFQFADGLYEVIYFYDGRAFYMDKHLERLEKGAKEIYLDLDFEMENLKKICRQAVRESGFKNATAYIQVTRGMAPRSHAFPRQSSCTWIVTVKEVKRHPEEFYENGVKCITVPDERWERCNIKTIQLLPNCIAKEKAKKAGCFEAIFHKGDCVTEGSSSNLFIVKGETLYTHPANKRILNGITRQCLIEEITKELDIKCFEQTFTLDTLFDADEVFLTGTTTEIMPVVKIDGKIIGDGVPGSITNKIKSEFRNLTKTVDR